jgi:hypothetical protein
MNLVLTELHATARRDQFLADAEHHRLVRQARVQRRTRVAKADTLKVLVSTLGLGRKPGVVEAHAA